MKWPTVSFVIPTFQAARTLRESLTSIRRQRYRGAHEILIIDGGSSDGTFAIAKEAGASIFPNPQKTAEAGKAIGVGRARGDLIAFVDADNILPDRDWLSRMVQPLLEDRTLVGGEPLAFTYNPAHPSLLRYFELAGVSDPLMLFCGNYDRFSRLTGRPTGLAIEMEDRGSYLVWILRRGEPFPTIGANGTVLRRSVFRDVPFGDYLFDIDVLAHLAERQGAIRFAKVKTTIHHDFVRDLPTFIRKQRRRVADFLYFERAGLRQFPWKQNLRGVFPFVASCLTVAPLLWQAGQAFVRFPDPAFFWHPIVSWATLWAYGTAVISQLVSSRPLPRTWQ